MSSDGKLIAADHAGRLSVLDAETGRVVTEREVTDGELPVQFSPNSRFLELSTDNGSHRLLDLRTSRVQNLPRSSSFAFDPNGHELAILNEGRLQFWDLRTGRMSSRRPPPIHRGPDGVAIAPDGTIALSGIFVNGIQLLPPHRPPTLIHGVNGSPHFSPDSKTLAVYRRRRFVLLAMPAGTRIGTELTLENPANGAVLLDAPIAFDLASRLVATTDGQTVRLWDLDSGSPIGPPLAGATSGIGSLAFSGPGQLTSAASDPTGEGSGEVRRWKLDVRTLQRQACRRANRDLTRAEWTQLVGTTIPYDPPCAAVLAH